MIHKVDVNFDELLGRLPDSINREEAAVLERASVEEANGLNRIAASVGCGEQASEINYRANLGVDVIWNNDWSLCVFNSGDVERRDWTKLFSIGC